MKDSLLLLSNFIKKPKEVGAVAPSSKFLTKGIIEDIDFKASRNIVELGPGLGTFTKAILKKSGPYTRVFCFEVNGKFCDYLRKNVIDERLTIINASAEDLNKNIRKSKVKNVDYVVSGLPFLNFSTSKKKRILQEIRDSLNDGGKFVLFQYTNGLRELLESYFGSVERKFVPLNVPPAFIYLCRK
ncbi:methyltransferase domain-containing protein [Candidatus Woesearchaeota archaeon]|nr:methyltransferase domain-containing protein [Candidatus Woesearchaeota archaeon]